ncbi:MAG: R3H domain-containing nucleic acid-binding protein [Candidatus Daviesbacteria bacterium]|nr:R3H domain-containing nucleic acid-binding protein [Candidatus Daviesbacteria bacterium]
MQEQLSEILDNVLGLLLLEGSYDIEEEDEGFKVNIDTKDAGRLIGARGESLEGLQLLVNQILSRKNAPKEGEFKRVIVDVMGWRKQKEADLVQQAKDWVSQVLETGKELELEPMAPWQRRVVHMTVSEITGVESESIGEGLDRHLVIKPAAAE